MQERMFYTEGNVSSCFREGEKDIWKAYVRRGMNSEKGQMKLRLLDWGCTVERCRRLQEELRRLDSLILRCADATAVPAGGALAVELAASSQAAMLGGVLTGSMLGATVVFTIPVAMGILEEKDRPVMAKGILCGIVTIPLGVLAGGLTAGFPIGMVLRNLIPIVIIAALIALGLWRAENAMVRGFEVFGKLVVSVVTVGLAAAIVEALTGFVIIPGMAPISEGFETVGTIAIVLAGAFPLVFVITKLLRKPLMAAGRWLGINDAAVSAAFVFGDHLGFTAGFAPEMIGPMIVGKLVGGVSAIAVAMWLTGKEEKS